MYRFENLMIYINERFCRSSEDKTITEYQGSKEVDIHS